MNNCRHVNVNEGRNHREKTNILLSCFQSKQPLLYDSTAVPFSESNVHMILEVQTLAALHLVRGGKKKGMWPLCINGFLRSTNHSDRVHGENDMFLYLILSVFFNLDDVNKQSLEL